MKGVLVNGELTVRCLSAIDGVCTLRVKDIEFPPQEIIVRECNGGLDAIKMLPISLVKPLQEHHEKGKVLHGRDLAEGPGDVYLPFALAQKHPIAGKEWGGGMFSRK